jgi:hypothetical protein
MAGTAKAVINLATGLEDAERVTVAFLVGGEAVEDDGGSLLACPICFSARKLDEGELVANGQPGGATPLWEWIGDDGATVFSY